jgi:signal transduction histidine kinase
VAKAVKWWLQFLGVAVVYVTAGKLGLHLAVQNPSATAVWLPTGIALAALLEFGLALWPAILVSAFIVNLTTAGGIAPSLVIAIGNTGEAVAGWYLVTRLAHGVDAFETATGVLRFSMFGALVSTTVSATVGVLALCAFHLAAWSDYGSVWLTWWLGDAAGALIGAPVLLLWARVARSYTAEQTGELTALAICLIVTGHLVLHGNALQWKFLCLPLLMWPALRFGPRETATAVVLLASLALFDNLESFGRTLTREREASLILVQVFMATMSAASLTASATFAERRRANDALTRHLATLEDQIAERTRALRASEASLSDLSARLLQMHDLDRRRFAQTLHEGAAQDVAGVSLHLAVAQRALESSRPDTREALEASLRLADEAVGSLRELASSLHPPVLDELGLAAAIRWYASGVAQERGVPVEVAVPVRDDIRVPLGVELAAFRIVQECLTNPQLHAGSAHVQIQMETGDAFLSLAIEGAKSSASTDARGVDVREGDVGIRGLRERVRQLGGQVAVVTDAGRVRVSLQLPTSASGSSGIG